MAAIDLRAGYVEISNFYRGNTLAINPLTITAGGSPVDLTGGSLRMLIEKKHGGTDYVTLTSSPAAGITITDAANGEAAIEVEGAETATWPSNCVLHADLEFTDAGGLVRTLVKFEIAVIEPITPPA